MTTITVPPTTLDVGTHAFTGAIDDVDNSVLVTLNRTDTGGLNELTSDSTVFIMIGQSDDGGATYYDSGGGGPWPGGIVPDKHGNPDLTDFIGTTFEPGTGRRARLTVTIAGPVPVVVSGTIVTS
jgi:hypothetical protein